CLKPRKQLPDLRVDELDLPPPLPDFGEQLGAVAAHLLRRLAQFVDLVEQPLHLRVAGHGRSLLKLGACHPAATGVRTTWPGGGQPAAPPAGTGPGSGAAAPSSRQLRSRSPTAHGSAPGCRPGRRPRARPRGGLRSPPASAARRVSAPPP